MNIYKELAKFNIVKYHDEPHIYYIGDQKLISGTAFIEQFKNKFDRIGTATKTAKKTRVTVEEVLADWDFKGDFSRTKGTLLHHYAENYWQNKIFPYDEKLWDEKFGEGLMTERLDACKVHFHNFHLRAKKNLIPVSMELVVGDAEIGIGGMVDCLFWNDKYNEYQIWDYKTSREIREYSVYRARLKAPLNFLHECEIETYSIQLNLYKYIIERNTNIKIGKCFIVHLHEDQDNYNIIECKEYQEIIQLLIDYVKKT